MLSFAEELLLLALDDEKGVIVDKTPIKYGLIGAMLMDLALMNKIDTDLENLMIVDSSPTGDDILDEALRQIAQSKTTRTMAYWIISLSQDSNAIKERLLNRLIEKNILKREQQKILWVFARRRYPVRDDKEEKEVKTRIREVILSDTIPDPHDVVLISLVKACYLDDEIFSDEEINAVQGRIEQIAKMDLIGQTVSRIIGSIMRAIAMAPLYPYGFVG